MHLPQPYVDQHVTLATVSVLKALADATKVGLEMLAIKDYVIRYVRSMVPATRVSAFVMWAGMGTFVL